MLSISTKMCKRNSQLSVNKELEMGKECITHLLMQHVGTCHWMQLTGLDQLLAHETQLTGGWSLQNRGEMAKGKTIRKLWVSLPFMPMTPPVVSIQ